MWAHTSATQKCGECDVASIRAPSTLTTRIPLSMQALVIVALLLVSAAPAMSIKWCVREGVSFQDTTEMQQCSILASMINKAVLTLDPSIVPSEIEKNTFTCVESSECETTALTDGKADLVVLKAKEQYRAARSWGALPMLAEEFSTTAGTADYYSVAVVKKELCDAGQELKDLKTKTLCSSSMRNTAGWYMPLSELMERGDVNKTLAECPNGPSVTYMGDVTAMQTFFSKGCVPGSDPAGPFCAQCGGNRTNGDFCTEAADPYSGQSGAFQCMVEGAGDVAIVKHVTPYLAMTSEWFISGDYEIENYMLMCKQGGCMSLIDFESCNIGMMSSPAVVYNPLSMDIATRKFVQEAIYTASITEDFRKTFFFNDTTGETRNEGSLIFKSGMTNLVKVDRDMRQFLGESFNLFDKITMMEDCEATLAPGIPVGPGGTIPRPGGIIPAAPVVVFKKKSAESPLTIALIVIISIAILVVLVLLGRSWWTMRNKDLFDRPGMKDEGDDGMTTSDVAPVMQHGSFLNSSFHNTTL